MIVLLGIGLCPILAVCAYVCATTYSKPGSQLREEINILKIATAVLAIVILLLLSSVNFAAIPNTPALVDSVALIEINHHHDSAGRPIFTQAIYWDWCPATQRHQVRAWRMVKRCEQLPRKDWRTGTYRATWLDGGVIRTVEAGAVRETWTRYDPEIAEREMLRRGDRGG